MKEKLLLIQQEIAAIKRDAKNPYFESNYFDINGLLAAVKPVLNKHKVVLLQPLAYLKGRQMLVTVLMDTESETELRFFFPLPENPDPQKMGSLITYYRRYALQSMLALEAEDDDANEASGKAKKAEDDDLSF